jgi:hypothetical protein
MTDQLPWAVYIYRFLATFSFQSGSFLFLVITGLLEFALHNYPIFLFSWILNDLIIIIHIYQYFRYRGKKPHFLYDPSAEIEYSMWLDRQMSDMWLKIKFFVHPIISTSTIFPTIPALLDYRQTQIYQFFNSQYYASQRTKNKELFATLNVDYERFCNSTILNLFL